jgi:hypothetical protein
MAPVNLAMYCNSFVYFGADDFSVMIDKIDTNINNTYIYIKCL